MVKTFYGNVYQTNAIESWENNSVCMCTYYYTPLGEDKFSGDCPSYQLTRSPGNICSIRPT